MEGAPSVPGINGPDPQIVGVAEKYAAGNGIDLKRQSEFIDSDRRAEIITKIAGDAVQQTGREGLRNAVQEAKPRNEAYLTSKIYTSLRQKLWKKPL